MRPVPFDVRDGAVLVEFPEASEADANRASVTLAARLRERPGVHDAIPGARSLLVLFDPRRLSHDTLRDAIDAAPPAGPAEGGTRRTLTVPAAYDGPDLEEIARRSGLSAAEVARRHGGAEYRVAFLGFAPGFAYLTGLPPELCAPRLPTPRTRVPAGSLAIGGCYTGIYPGASPGGWRLIGRTTLRLLDPGADPPALLRAGDRVRFEAVSAGELPRPAPPPERRVADGRAPILRIASPGLSATIQGVPGGGRGLGASGIPPGGAIDPIGLARANARVGNAPGLAGIEMAFVGCELEVLEDTVVACAGGFEPERNGRPAPPEEAFTVAKGDRLRLGRVRRGVWGYLAVRGGLEPPARFAPQPRLSAGDLVAAGTERAAAARATNAGDPEAPREIRLRALPGPEADAFAPSELARFFESSWRVSTESDRRGLRLEGLDGAAPLAHLATSTSEIPPSGMVPGSIQVPGGGLPIVLGPDGPVTGGYPRIATVIGADRPLLGRAAPGALVRFVRVGLEEALEARSSLSAGVS